MASCAVKEKVKKLEKRVIRENDGVNEMKERGDEGERMKEEGEKGIEGESVLTLQGHRKMTWADSPSIFMLTCLK